ncbi:putative trypsin-6 [Drosophila eugracilis]|uniref:putative trypsin-6 n=1 Tax=Drosophila eugracilis TaxID=29029 RepID=UPI001BD9A085|nr:putative trypsin-6 [Drosophila eugracilis]
MGLVLHDSREGQGSRGDPSRNESSTTFNRTKRLSDGKYDDDVYPLSKVVVSIRTRQARRFFGDNHFCSGVILAPLFVMTSSHCLMNNRRVKYYSGVLVVIGGTYNRLKYIHGETFISPVSRTMLPDSFTMDNKEAVGLLKLSRPFPRTSHIAIAQLPTRPPLDGLLCNVLGWGQMYHGGPLASHMLYINVEIISREKCKKWLDVPQLSVLCAIGNPPTSPQQPCAGDLGSPLISNNIVYGVVAATVACETNHLPSIYTDVYSNVQWVQGKIVANAGSLLTLPALVVFSFGLIFYIFTYEE